MVNVVFLSPSRTVFLDDRRPIMETPLSPLNFARRLYADREAVVEGSLRFTYRGVVRLLEGSNQQWQLLRDVFEPLLAGKALVQSHFVRPALLVQLRGMFFHGLAAAYGQRRRWIAFHVIRGGQHAIKALAGGQ